MPHNFSFTPHHLDLLGAIDFSWDDAVIARLEQFVELVMKWNAQMNLVRYDQNVDTLVARHLIDSLQLVSFLPEAPNSLVLTDFGSGGGFPGMVLAMVGFSHVHLVEANKKKCAFLYEAASLAPSEVTIHSTRIETLAAWDTDIITARALSSLDTLLDYVYPFMQRKKCLPLLLKGCTIKEEIKVAEQRWECDYALHDSISGEGSVLTLFHVEPK